MSVCAKFKFSILAFVLLFVSACFTNPPNPSEEEINASINTSQWLEDKYGVINDRRITHMVHRVTTRLGAGVYPGAMRAGLDAEETRPYLNYPWQVFLNTDDPNAFSIGAGVIFVTRGLLAELETEAQLASVIAHEMSHQVLGHTRMALMAADPAVTAPPISYTINSEMSADALGLKLLHASRYDLKASLYALSITYRPIGDFVQVDEPEWLERRLSNLQLRIKDAGNYYPATDNTREFVMVRQLLGNG